MTPIGGHRRDAAGQPEPRDQFRIAVLLLGRRTQRQDHKLERGIGFFSFIFVTVELLNLKEFDQRPGIMNLRTAQA